MPNYKFSGFEGASIAASVKKLPGQSHRCSYNYDFRDLNRKGHLQWHCPPGITFDVMEDRAAATDPYTFRNVTDGYVTDFPSESACNGLYIANPSIEGNLKEQDDWFQIQVRAID